MKPARTRSCQIVKDPTTDLILRLTERPYRLAVYALFLLAAVWFTARIVVLPAGRLTHGFGAYYSASRLLVTGTYSERVYDGDYFRALVRADTEGQAADVWLNPPTTTFLLLPLAPLPIRLARALWTGLNVLLLFGGLALLIRTFAPGAPLAIWLLIFIVAMLFRPVVANFVLGQAYILVFLLLVISVVGLHRHRDVAGGLSLGLALALKLVGWPLALLLLWLRKWRYLAIFVGTVALVLLVSLPLLGSGSWPAFADTLDKTLASPFICVPAYQTTRSWLCHLLAPEVSWMEVGSLTLPWFAPLILLAAGAVTLALSLPLADRQPVAGAAALIVWGLLFAPLGEEYHQVVVLIPIVWLLLAWWSGYPHSRASLAALAIALFLYTVPFPINHPRLQQGWLALAAYPRLYAAWLVWLALILLPGRRFLPTWAQKQKAAGS